MRSGDRHTEGQGQYESEHNAEYGKQPELFPCEASEGGQFREFQHFHTLQMGAEPVPWGEGRAT